MSFSDNKSDAPLNIETQLTSNRLADEKSPYLQQHASNPVSWYPWGDEAFKAAREQDKPIFLSIGYSTCHWCHVMAHESFEDPEVARLLNETFINIKVDREERPDVDQVYMTVCHLLTGGGGWPLSIFMTADKKPFFAATYIPKRSGYGRNGLLELVPRIQEIWTNERERIDESTHRVVEALGQTQSTKAGDFLDKTVFDKAFSQFERFFDVEFGGFGDRPKFPTPHKILFLLRYWKRTGNENALAMAVHTLDAMRRGGIFDHVGYGFHRYSTDRQWLLPHFEKMLYDQALLVMAYVEAFQVTRFDRFKRTAEEILQYVQKDMTHPGGAFYSAEDADSEGEEGRFYVWTWDELKEILGENDAQNVARWMNAQAGGNFMEEATGEAIKKNILHRRGSWESLADSEGESEANLLAKWELIRGKLFERREGRIRPLRDEKILVDWNGLMISAFMRAGRVFDRPEYLELGTKGLEFLLKNMVSSDGRLLHRYKSGQAEIHGFADDYAFFIQALLDAYEAGFNVEFLQWAIKCSDAMAEDFWDSKQSGFFLSPVNGEALLIRSKEIYDGAAPSANSVAISNYARLYRLTGDEKWQSIAERIVRAFSEQVRQDPWNFSQFLMGLDWLIGPCQEVVFVGDSEKSDFKEMCNELELHYIPRLVRLARPVDGPGVDAICNLAPFTLEQVPIDDCTTLYICTDHACQNPINRSEDLSNALQLAQN